jgi:glycosyltransferase involved in cell wall biosynthesis
VHRLPRGVDFEKGASDRGALHRLLGLDAATPIVGWMGRMCDDKRPERFVRLATQLAHMRDDVHFVLIGDGPSRGATAGLVATLGATQRVHLIGVRHDVARWLPSLTVLVLFPVGCGMPVAAVEAMAAGVPVVTVGIGGLPEAVVHGETGLVVDDDPQRLCTVVSELVADRATLERMSVAARARARRCHAIGQCVDTFAQLFAALAQREPVLAATSA